MKKLGKAIASGIVKTLPWVPTVASFAVGIVSGMIIKNVDIAVLHMISGAIVGMFAFITTVRFHVNERQKCIMEKENIYDFDNNEEINIFCVKNQEDDTLSFDEDINSKC